MIFSVAGAARALRLLLLVGAIAGGLVPPILTFFATDSSWNLGFAIPMTIGAMLGLVNFVIALLLGPETKDVEMVPDLVVA